MLKVGGLLTLYLGASLILFMVASNTINGAIIYLLALLPIYGAVLIVGWILAWQRRHQPLRLHYGLWGVVLALQLATLLTSPANCFRAKEGARCYSNLQVLVGSVPRTGESSAPHWILVEDAFPGVLIAYDVALILGVTRGITVSR